MHCCKSRQKAKISLKTVVKPSFSQMILRSKEFRGNNLHEEWRVMFKQLCRSTIVSERICRTLDRCGRIFPTWDKWDLKYLPKNSYLCDKCAQFKFFKGQESTFVSCNFLWIICHIFSHGRFFLESRFAVLHHVKCNHQ
jgi:hypothetical protein